MKRTLAIVLSIVMMLATCTILASAANTWGTTQEDFAAVGDLEIAWDPDVKTKITFDGKMDDWVNAGYTPYKVEPRNMAAWVGDSTTMPENWSLTAYFVADSERLYVGFYITDPKAVIGTNPAGYDGDAFQICVDWGRNLGDYMDAYGADALANPKNIFYSFAMVGSADDIQPLQFMRQESDRDGLVYDGIEDPGEENEFAGATGRAGLTETGWCAEFSITWNRLSADCEYKLYDPKFYRKAAIGPAQDLKIGCALYYLNRDDQANLGNISWAAGTTKGVANDDGTPSVSWTARDNGVNLVLKWHEGMTFAENAGIRILETGETEGTRPEETEPVTTEPQSTAVVTTVAPESKSEPESTAAPATGTKAEATTAAGDKGGCSSAIGAGAVAVLLSAAAAAVALKKKH